MAAVRSKNTKPEMLVRRLVHSMGYRYRLHRKDLPGKPDLAFPARRKVIFVHGCFWHQHESCKGSRMPKSNLDYWTPKLERNQIRDAERREELRLRGWDSLVLWECELKQTVRIRKLVRGFLGRA